MIRPSASTRSPARRMMALAAAPVAFTMLAFAAPAALAQSNTQVVPIHAMTAAPSLNLSAFGETRVAPDMATINFGVMTEAVTAADAMSQNATRMNQVMEALRRAGIEARDIQTSNLNLQPQYTYAENQPPVLRGYQVTNQVTVKIRDLTRVGRTADAVVGAGVNQIDSISFGLNDPTEAENAARRAAVVSLRQKAELYAQALGVPLGQIRNLSEGGGYAPTPPVPMFAVRAQAMDMAGNTSVSGGELTIRVDITGVYDIGR